MKMDFNIYIGCFSLKTVLPAGIWENYICSQKKLEKMILMHSVASQHWQIVWNINKFKAVTMKLSEIQDKIENDGLQTHLQKLKHLFIYSSFIVTTKVVGHCNLRIQRCFVYNHHSNINFFYCSLHEMKRSCEIFCHVRIKVRKAKA